MRNQSYHDLCLLFVLLSSSFIACKSFSAATKNCRRHVLSHSFADGGCGPRTLTALLAATTTTPDHRIEQVLSDDRVLDVASFRNGLCNPEMMVERQQAKQDSIDRSEAAMNGLKIGLLIIGPPFAIYQWYSTASIQDGLIAYVTLGGTSGIMLALNNYLGGGVHVPTVAEATNRILVDYAEGLKRRQDVGFVALLVATNDDDDEKNREPFVFAAATNGVVACADGQWRNSNSLQCPAGTQRVAGYPPHLHIKNMLVHESVRRRGIGTSLIDAFHQYALEQTDAELLTLEVEDSNTAAITLYEMAGFEKTKNPTAFSKRIFMVKPLQRPT